MGNRQKKKNNRSDPVEIPQLFFERLARIIPGELWTQARDSFYLSRKTAFRWNPLLPEEGFETGKTQVLDDLRRALPSLKPISWFPDGYVVEPGERECLVSSSPVEDARIYIQNPSSFLPCLVLDPQPGEQILDLAAAPGGKTLLLAALMENRGRISAVEPIRNRFFKLQANLKRYGVQIARTYLMDGRSAGNKVPDRFDRVLIDTPCSGESRIHSANPESYAFWSERKLKEQSRKQYGLIRSAFRALKPGGRLVYCTCSFAPEENENIINDFLDEEHGAELVEFNVPKDLLFQHGLEHWKDKTYREDLARTIRIIPDRLMNGFYIAAIRKLA